ncbi:hypothetical protein TELCIR_11633, partial [Teladorsagia circumcincta]
LKKLEGGDSDASSIRRWIHSNTLLDLLDYALLPLVGLCSWCIAIICCHLTQARNCHLNLCSRSILSNLKGSYCDNRPSGMSQCGYQPSMFTIYSTSPGLRHIENPMDMNSC